MKLPALRRLALMPAPVLVVAMLGPWTSSSAQDGPGGTTSVLVSAEGKQVYEEICQACHMADAKGGGGAGAVIPALAGNPKLADKDYAITLLLKGRGGMPWLTDILTRKQMAAVVTYVRSHFNNYPDVVTEADVDRVAATPPPKVAT
jgi:mono/diheme cytochrome c family protein